MTGPYAGPVSRVGAFAVDAGLVLVLACATGGTVDVLASVLVGVAPRALARTVAALTVLALPALMTLYCTAFWATVGRTPGMALLNLRLVRTRGGRVGWFPALLRAVILVVLPIGWLWCLVDRRYQAVADKVARTLVVYAHPVTRAV